MRNCIWANQYYEEHPPIIGEMLFFQGSGIHIIVKEFREIQGKLEILWVFSHNNSRILSWFQIPDSAFLALPAKMEEPTQSDIKKHLAI